MSFLFNRNFKVSKEERFDTANARSVLLKQRTLIGYSQLYNSGVQAFVASTRTQLINDGLGPNGFSTVTLWNPINNRINLQDAKAGDYIRCYLLLPYSGSGFIPSLRVQLDYSPLLDGSQVINNPILDTVLAGGGYYQYSINFVVIQDMKENGIGIMGTSSIGATVTGAKLVLEMFPSTTG